MGSHPVIEAEEVAAHAAQFDHLQLCFGPNGNVDFYAETLDARRLAARFGGVIKMIFANPHLLAHAAGYCGNGKRQEKDPPLAAAGGSR